MCTLALYHSCVPGLSLVVAANRDEYLERPATGPELLCARPRIVGGRDLRAGGTWLAVSERGMVAGVLNRRATGGDAPRSRGELPLLMLRASSAAEAERHLASIDPRAYKPFNLLVADAERAWVAQNRDAALSVTALAPGVHVLTNLDVDDPRCPRIAGSHRAFAEAGAAYAHDRREEDLRAALAAILSDHTTALDPRRPDPLGALCAHLDGYGTRCSSLVLLDADGTWRHWFADGPPCTTAYAPAPAP